MMKYTEKTVVVRTMDAEDFKAKVDLFRVDLNDLAEKLDVTTQKVARWINGTTLVPEEYFDDIEKYMEDKRNEMIALLTNA